AKCKTQSSSPVTWMWLLTSWKRNSKFGSERWCAMFLTSPVTRLSIAITCSPSLNNRSVKWLPIKPPPPVIKIRMSPFSSERESGRAGERERKIVSRSPALPLSRSVLAANPAILESRALDRFRIEYVAAIHNNFVAHHFAEFFEFKVAELLPLCH